MNAQRQRLSGRDAGSTAIQAARDLHLTWPAVPTGQDALPTSTLDGAQEASLAKLR